ncbi:MAG: FecR domain-containing protein [Gammaproteobacteria bacterium]|nr:FecR domain-containing protein [Gammaproteobacteria bacterium]
MLSYKEIIRHTMILSIIALPINAFAEAGKAIFVLGKAHIESADGRSVEMKQGALFNSGDTIVTSERGQVQLRMADGTLIAVRPNSRFVIEKFQYDKNKQTDQSIYNLVKGGFRSITGKIGHDNKKSYGVTTVVGTIGIRGTDFSAYLCDTNCNGNQAGLYVGVMDGGITVSNNVGQVNLDPGEYGYVQDITTQPASLPAAPGDLLFASTGTGTDDTALADSSTTSMVVADSGLAVQQTLLQPEVLVASTGTYDLSSGTISDGLNNSGVLSSGSMNIDFIAATVSTSFSGSINNASSGFDWVASSTSGTLDIASGQFSGSLDGSVGITDFAFGGTAQEAAAGTFSGTLGTTTNTVGIATDASYSYNMTSSTASASGDANYTLASYTTQVK